LYSIAIEYRFGFGQDCPTAFFGLTVKLNQHLFVRCGIDGSQFVIASDPLLDTDTDTDTDAQARTE
jgi:hypothetical protein